MTLEEWLTRYGRAWRERDDAGVAELFTDDAVYRSSPTGPAHVGKDAIAAYWREATGTQSGLRIVFGTPVREGTRAVVEWWATMLDPDWRPEAGTAEVTLPGCLILRFAADRRCRELREYYNPVFGAAASPPDGWGD